MPLRWQQGTNPYRHNYFGRLGVGPNATPVQIDAQAKKRLQKLSTGKGLELDGQPLDDFAVSEASKQLREPGTLAEELLLVHPQDGQQERDWKKAIEQLRQAAELPIDGRPPELVHPLALLWFLPAPSFEGVDKPPWQALGLVEPGDPADAALDIVFDE